MNKLDEDNILKPKIIYNGSRLCAQIAFMENKNSDWLGWIFIKHPDGQWVSLSEIPEYKNIIKKQQDKQIVAQEDNYTVMLEQVMKEMEESTIIIGNSRSVVKLEDIKENLSQYFPRPYLNPDKVQLTEKQAKKMFLGFTQDEDGDISRNKTIETWTQAGYIKQEDMGTDKCDNCDDIKHKNFKLYGKNIIPDNLKQKQDDKQQEYETLPKVNINDLKKINEGVPDKKEKPIKKSCFNCNHFYKRGYCNVSIDCRDYSEWKPKQQDKQQEKNCDNCIREYPDCIPGEKDYVCDKYKPKPEYKEIEKLLDNILDLHDYDVKKLFKDKIHELIDRVNEISR